MSSRGTYSSPRDFHHADYCPVTVCFQDTKISLLFAELISAYGMDVRLLRRIEDFDGTTRIVTEPCYFPHIPKQFHDQCLVVGDRDSLRDIRALSLSRPLTENKVEEALSQFLKVSH